MRNWNNWTQFQPTVRTQNESLFFCFLSVSKIPCHNSLFGHFLARLRRKTKCYTKAKYMLVHSVKLLMLKRNNQLAILF